LSEIFEGCGNGERCGNEYLPGIIAKVDAT